MPFKHDHTSSNSSCSPTKETFVDDSLKALRPHGLFHRLGGNNSNLNLTTDTMQSRPSTPVSVNQFHSGPLHAPPMTSPNANVSTGSTLATAPGIRAQLGQLLPRHTYFQAEVQIHQISNVPLVSGEFAVRWKFKGVQSASGNKPGLLNRVKAKAKAEKERRDGKGNDVTLSSLGGIVSPAGGSHPIPSPVQRSASGSQSVAPSVIAPSVSSRSSCSTYSQPSNTNSNISSSTNNTLSFSDSNGNTPTSSTLFSPSFTSETTPSPSTIPSTLGSSTTTSTVSTPGSSTPARGTTPYLPLKDHSVTWSYVLSPILKMDVDRETHDLLPCPLKLVVLQKIDEEDAKMKGSASNPQLGVVYLNLAEYVDKDGEEETGEGSTRKKKGRKAGCSAGVERSYLLKESKTNATLKLTVRLIYLHGESNYIAPPLPQGGILTGIAGFLKQNDAVRKRPRALDLDLEESKEMRIGGIAGDGSVTATALRTATIGIGMMPGTPRSIGTTLPPRTARTLGGYGDAPFTPIPPLPNSSMPKSARVPRVLHNIAQEDEDDDYSNTISVISPLTGRPLPRRSTTGSTSDTYTSSSLSASSSSQPNSPVFTSPSRRVIYGSPKSMSPQLAGTSPAKQQNATYANSNADLALGLLAVDIHRLPAPGFGNGLGSRTKATEALIDAIFNPIAVRAPEGTLPPLSIQKSEYTTVAEEERIRRRYETPFVRYEEAVEEVEAGNEESDSTTDTEGEGYRDAEGWSDAEGERDVGKSEAPDTAKPASPTTARPGAQLGGKATRWIMRKKVAANTVDSELDQTRHIRRNTRDSNSDASVYSGSTGTSNSTASSGSRRNSEDTGFGRRRRDVTGQQQTLSNQGHDNGYPAVNGNPQHNGSAYHVGEEDHATSSHTSKTHQLGTSMKDWWKRHAGSRPGTPTGIKA